MQITKAIEIVLFIIIVCVLFVGCEVVEQPKDNLPPASENRFMSIGDDYVIEKHRYNVVYDSKTQIVYLVSNSDTRSTLCVMYDGYGQPMTYEMYLFDR